MSDAFVRPIVTDLNRGFWDGAAAGRLQFQRCGPCRHLRYPCADRCPRCLSTEWAWDEVSGRGEVLSRLIFHQVYHPGWKDRVPYNVILVQLDEGPRLFSNLLPLDRTDIDVGTRVRVVFDDEDGLALPRFVEDGEP